MYPDLSYILHAILGTPVDNWLSIFKTFGFFLALAFLASAYVFAIEMHRKAKEGFYKPDTITMTIGAPATWMEIGSNALVGLLLFGKGAYASQHFATFRTDPASVILSLKMHWLAGILGALVLGGLTWWEAWRKRKPEPEVIKRQVYPHHRVSEMTVWAAVGGILGAKIFDLFDNWESFLADPIGSLTSGGGLAFFGGLVMGFVAVVSYMYRNNIPFWPTADAVSPALVTGYGVGRIGCQMSGDGDWGIVNNAPKPGWVNFLPDSFWSSTYPHHVLNTPHTDPVASVPIEGCTWDYCMQLSEPVYPTPIYEVAMMAVVFAILWSLRKRLKVSGVMFFVYLFLIALERYIIEKIRVNVEHNVLGITLTQAEIISLCLMLISVVGIIFLYRKRQATERID